MRHTQIVARLYGIDELDERQTNGLIVVLERLALHDRSEEVPAFLVVHHEVDVVLLMDDMVQRRHIGMPGHGAMEHDLALLQLLKLRVALVSERDLHGVELRRILWRRGVPCEVDDAVCTFADDMGEA